MWYIIITSRCVLWTLFSLLATFMMQEAIFSPEWLIAPNGNDLSALGVFTKCNLSSLMCQNAISHTGTFDLLSIICTGFLVIGVVLMCVAISIGTAGFFLQSIYKKSIFIIAGSTQVFAGMCFIMGVMLYPMSWRSLEDICGKDSSPFYPGLCTLGTGIWLSASATLLTFASAYLSSSAQKSTNTYKVQEKINKGYKIVFLL